MSTSTIKVAVNGTPAFTWEGSEAEVKQVLETFPNATRRLGQSPQQLANSILFHLIRDNGKLLSNEDAGREFQMMAVIWRILEAKTNNAGHPGKIADYIGVVSFDVDIRSDPDGGGCTFDVEAKGNFDA